MRMVLGSSSPRRKELLEQMGFKFEVDPPYVDEVLHGNTPEEIAENIVLIKGEHTYRKHPDAVIVCADTIVVCNNLILGKPLSPQEAYTMIELIQGTQHQVVTAVYVRYQDSIERFVSVAMVEVDHMSQEEIQTFIETKEPYDKSGGYGVQGDFFKFVKRVEGDFYTIMGLPSNQTYRAIQKVIK
jgi:septum formation protein